MFCRKTNAARIMCSVYTVGEVLFINISGKSVNADIECISKQLFDRMLHVSSDKICDLATQYLLLATEVGANFFFFLIIVLFKQLKSTFF